MTVWSHQIPVSRTNVVFCSGQPMSSFQVDCICDGMFVCFFLYVYLSTLAAADTFSKPTAKYRSLGLVLNVYRKVQRTIGGRSAQSRKRSSNLDSSKLKQKMMIRFTVPLERSVCVCVCWLYIKCPTETIAFDMSSAPPQHTVAQFVSGSFSTYTYIYILCFWKSMCEYVCAANAATVADKRAPHYLYNTRDIHEDFSKEAHT